MRKVETRIPMNSYLSLSGFFYMDICYFTGIILFCFI